MTPLQSRFGHLVAASRRSRGLTQQALAEAAGLSVDMIGRVEAGSTGASFSTISQLADALQVDPATLFSPEVSLPARSPLFVDLLSRLATLSERDLRWVSKLLDAALLPR